MFKKSTGKLTIHNQYNSSISLNIDGTDFGVISPNTAVSHNLSAALKTLTFQSVDIASTDPAYFSKAQTIDLQQCSETSLFFGNPNSTTTTNNNNNSSNNNNNSNIVSDCEQKNVGALTIENAYDISLTLKIDGADFGPILKKSTVSFSVSAGFRTITLEPVGTTVSDANYFKKSQTVDLQQCSETKLTYTDPCDGVVCNNGGTCFEGVCNPYHSDQVCVDLLIGTWTMGETKTWKNGVEQVDTTTPSGTYSSRLTFDQYTISDANSSGNGSSVSTYTPNSGSPTTVTDNFSYKVKNDCSILLLESNNSSGSNNTFSHDIITLTTTEFIIETTQVVGGDTYKYRSTLNK